MTDDSTAIEHPSENREEPEPRRRVDPFLRDWVHLADLHGLEMRLILSVGGLLISGTTTSTEAFLRYFGDVSARTFRPPGIGEEVRQAVEHGIRSPGGGLPAPDFIHLKDAQVFHPGGSPIPDHQKTWWRVRLDAVDGFTLGTLG